MDRTEEKIVNDILKDKKEWDILSKYELQYLKNVCLLEKDAYSKSKWYVFRYKEWEDIFLEGELKPDQTLKITYIS